MSKYTLLMILGFLLFYGTAKSQQNNLNSWYQYTLTSKLSDNFNLVTLTQYRSYDALLNTRLFLVNGYLEYKIPNTTIYPAAGYMNLILEPYKADGTKNNINENRLFQQVTIRGTLGRRLIIVHRYRVEERFIPNDYTTRLRYLVALKLPFGKLDKTDHVFYATFKNEIRVNALSNPFDSDLIWGGMGYLINPSLAIETSWMTQLDGHNRYDNYAVLNLRQWLNFSRHKKGPRHLMDIL